jgi:hypothetical protein
MESSDLKSYMGKNMNFQNNLKKNILIFTLILVIYPVTSEAKKRGEYATQNLIGQVYYMKNCSSCHGEGSRGGNMASIREWKSIFIDDAKELIYFHSDDDESINVVKYLKSNFFKIESEQMLGFLQEFAYDSENIPTCN